MKRLMLSAAVVAFAIAGPAPGVAPRVRLAAFVDAGTIGLDPIWTFESPWVVTPGAGVRIQTPIGPLRMDLGYNPHPGTRGPLLEAREDGGGSGVPHHLQVAGCLVVIYLQRKKILGSCEEKRRGKARHRHHEDEQRGAQQCRSNKGKDDPAECLLRPRHSSGQCAWPKHVVTGPAAFPFSLPTDAGRVSILDLSDRFCPKDVCSAARDGVVVMSPTRTAGPPGRTWSRRTGGSPWRRRTPTPASTTSPTPTTISSSTAG
jgi:hypothetical protein